MQKIITVFQRNYETDRLVRDEVTPGAEWVLAGEGVATRKWDGACCMVRGHRAFKRYELKAGRTAPAGFEPMQAPDPKTGDQPGWVPINFDVPENKWFRAAFEQSAIHPFLPCSEMQDGTYEAVGPHFGGGGHNKNPEGLDCDLLKKHGDVIWDGFPRDFEGMKTWLIQYGGLLCVEGVVFHHPDGRMAKIKARDFGIGR